MILIMFIRTHNTPLNPTNLPLILSCWISHI